MNKIVYDAVSLTCAKKLMGIASFVYCRQTLCSAADQAVQPGQSFPDVCEG